MRKVFVAAGVIAVVASVLARPVTASEPQAPVGALGPIDALGQDFRLPPPPTGPPPRLLDGTIDLGDGIWVGMRATGRGIAQGLKPGEELPLLPSAKEAMAASKGTDDPVNWCLPLGVVRPSPYPIRFIQNYTHKKPTHMYILSEWMGSFRQIFLDGRKHPAELEPTWFGHSIGWYEGDTLVIDTVGFNDKFWFDRLATPHTERLHTIERWTRRDAGHLVRELTIDDPGTFSRPFTVTAEMTLRPPGDELMEYVCQENNQYGTASGASQPSAAR